MKRTAYEKMEKYVSNMSPKMLVSVYNDYCADRKHYDDILYPNTDGNLQCFLPVNPVDCFREGHMSVGTYFCSDDYIRLDGTNHIVSCNASAIDLEIVVDYLLEQSPKYVAKALSCSNYDAMYLLEDDNEEEEE